MNFPNPMDAFKDPVQYYTDLALFQMDLMRQSYAVACAMNPFLPEGLMAAAAPVSPRRKPAKARTPVRRTAARPAPAAPVAKAEAVVEIAKPAPEAPAAAKAPSAKKAVSKKPAAKKPVARRAATKKPAPKPESKPAITKPKLVQVSPAPKEDASVQKAKRAPRKKTVTLAPDLPKPVQGAG